MKLQELVEALSGKLTESVARRRRYLEVDWSNVGKGHEFDGGYTIDTAANEEIIGTASALVALLRELLGRAE